MQYLLLFSCSVLLLACQPAAPNKSTCPQRKELELYVNNDSWTDSLVQAHVVLDDSVVVNAGIVRRRTGGERRYSSFPICPGRHRLKVHFGAFHKDTLLLLRGDQSLFITLAYAPYEGAINGIAVGLLEHDYDWYHRID